MKKLLYCMGLCALTGLASTAVRAVDVTVSIKPIHSLVAGVMGEIGTPNLLVVGAASPHSYQMRPSDAAVLTNSDLIVWVGEHLEAFLDRPIANLSAKAHIMTLKDHPDIDRLPSREGGLRLDKHEGHDDHDDHAEHGSDHDDHDDHAEHSSDHDDHDDHDDHAKHGSDNDDHEEHAEHSTGHDKHKDHSDEGDMHTAHAGEKDGHHDHHGHDHGEFDLHIWLSPNNAAKIVSAVAEELSEIDPDNAATYQANATKMLNRIAAKTAELTQSLFLLSDHKFIVFHDAYQYFEKAFNLNHAGSIHVDPSRPAGAKRLKEIRSALTAQNIKCVFTEPQFSPDVVSTIIEGIDINTAILDPLGAEVKVGEDAWFEIMDRLGMAFQECLVG